MHISGENQVERGDGPTVGQETRVPVPHSPSSNGYGFTQQNPRSIFVIAQRSMSSEDPTQGRGVTPIQGQGGPASVPRRLPPVRPGSVNPNGSGSIYIIRTVGRNGAVNTTAVVPPSIARGVKPQSRRRCYTFLGVLIGLALVAAIILAVVFGRKAKDDDEDFRIQRDFHGVFTIAWSWSDDMADTTSYSFRNFARTLEPVINDIYQESSLRGDVNTSKIIRLRKLSFSSTEVTFAIKVTKLQDSARSKRSVVSGERSLTRGSSVQESDVRDAFTEGYRALLGSYSTSSARKRLLRTISLYTISITEASTFTARPTTTQTTYMPESTRCGEVRTMPDFRIVGGSAADQGVFPWMVMILKQRQFICGGSILDPLHVITAGHCLKDEPSSWTGLVNTRYYNIEVIAGKHQSKTVTHFEWEQRVSAASGYMHPSFSSDPLYNDIAVIRLSRPLVFNSRVSPICLPAVTDTLPQRCVVAGWGATDYETQSLPDELRTVSMRAYNRTECQRTFGSVFTFDNKRLNYYLKAGMMCAANGTYGGQDSCQGDSGGPLFCLQDDKTGGGQHYTQFGVVSWGDDCGKPRSPGFYAYLPSYVSWLRDSALPKLGSSPNSSAVDTTCRTFSPLTDYRLPDCRAKLQLFKRDGKCPDLEEAMSCVQNALSHRGHTCYLRDIYITIVNSRDMGLTSEQRQRCEALNSSALNTACSNKTAVTRALDSCTHGKDCVTMLDVTLCIHRHLDPDWLHCSRQDIEDVLQNSFNASLTLCQDYTVRTLEDGRQFMYVKENWLAVCADHWGQNEVKVSCTHQGYATGKPSYIPWTKENLYVTADINALGWVQVTCSGSESSLARCQLNRHATCSRSYIAATVCYNTAYRFELEPSRPTDHYGYVRLTRDEGQGHVCVPDLPELAADLLCREAGFVAGMTFSRPLPAPSSGAVWRAEMDCSDGTVDINGCVNEAGWTLLPRTPGTCAPAKVFCFGTDTRFHNALFNKTGLVQMYRPTTDGRDVTLKTVCRTGFDDDSASVVCRQNGFPHGGRALSFNPFYPPVNDYVTVRCSGGESKLEDCQVYDASRCWSPAVAECTEQHLDTVSEMSLKLSYDNQEVLVYSGGQWGTICADHWTSNEAAAVCRQLGHLHGYRSFGHRSRNLPHVLHALQCGTSVSSIQQCNYEHVQSNVCRHVQSAGVTCTNQTKPVYSLRGSSQPNEGQVYMHYNGTTAPLVASSMSDSAISVLCQSMGYVTGQRHVGSGRYTYVSSAWYGSFNRNCSYGSDIHHCLLHEPVFLSCSNDYRCRYSLHVYCYTAAARVHTGVGTTTGIVQLYREGQWWQVCHNSITQSAADVICRDVMGSSSAAAIRLKDAYQHTSAPSTVKAHSNCNSLDRNVTSAECVSIDTTSSCESFNNHPAGVVCYDGSRPSGRITGWKKSSASLFAVEDRVMVQRYGVWGTVCDDQWFNTQADLLCKHLSYNRGSYGEGLERDPAVPMWAWSVDCTLFSSDIDRCLVSLTDEILDDGTCVSNKDASVRCRNGYY